MELFYITPSCCAQTDFEDFEGNCISNMDEQMRESCYKIQYSAVCQAYDGYYSLHNESIYYFKFASRCTSLMSGLSLLLVGFFIFVHPNFQKHPYPLIALACLSEASLYLTSFYTNFTCLYEWPSLLSYTLNFPNAVFTWSPLSVITTN